MAEKLLIVAVCLVVFPLLFGWIYDRCAPGRLAAQMEAIAELKRRRRARFEAGLERNPRHG